jgi:DNA repair photolyase
MIPALNDHELDAILAAAAEAGATTAGTILVRLPHELRDLFEEWLHTHYPDRARRVLSLLRASRGGKLYDATYGTRMRGEGPYADALAARFALACRRLGLGGRGQTLDCSQFRVPPAPGEQLGLFS